MDTPIPDHCPRHSSAHKDCGTCKVMSGISNAPTHAIADPEIVARYERGEVSNKDE
jgi:hypothetical protein